MSPQNPAVEALGVAVAARVPVLLWGAPGTGKTSAIRAMAQTMGLPCETVIASIREPSDFAGLPIVVGDGVRFAPPAWARRLAEAGHGLLFLDELSTAPPAVQAALLRVVLERAVGDLTLPDAVAVVAAANPPEQAADGWDLSAPLANRLCHLAWQTDPRSVADGLAGGWAAPVVPVLPDGWQAEEILSRGLVAAFLHVRPALACAPPSDAASAGRGWPSPRTWEMAARLMAAAGASGSGDEARSALIRGAVGDGAGVEFLAWLIEMDLPDPEQVLADPASFRLPERGDRAYAALAAIAAAVAADPTPDRWTAGWRVLGLAADAAPDVAAVAARVLARCRPDGAALPAEIHLFAPGAARRGPDCRREAFRPGAGVPEIAGLAAARLWAASRFPYLATGVFGAQVVAERGSGTVSVDESWRMHADPELTVAWTPAQLGSVLIHHVCHLLRTHGERAQAVGIGPDEARTWVRAADAEINDDLVPAGLDLPGRPVLPHDLGAEDGLLAEQYFDGIRRAQRASAQEARGGREAGNQDRSAPSQDGETAGSWLDCGSGADGMPRPGQGPGGLPAWQADLLRRQVAQDVVAHAKQAGTVPAGLLRWAEEILSPKVNWRALLTAELRRAVAEVSGAVDYSYRRPSRRSAVSGQVVLPALRRPVPEVAVVCDTSGSMTADLLAMVLAEVEGLLRALGLARQVRVLACDTAVAPAQRVNSARQVQLTGGGGTNMGAGIDAAAALRPKPAVTVVLTDGYTPWPAAAPKGMRIVVGLLGAQAPDAPPWARAVRVEPD